MREVVIRSWCDACDALEEPVKNESEHTAAMTLTSVGSKPRSLDLCDRHYKELVAPLEALLRSHGATNDQAPVRASEVPRSYPKNEPKYDCPQCSLVGARRGVITHLVHIHGMDEVEASRAVPPEGESAECPDCGYLAHLGTGMSTHLRFAHKHSKERARAIQQGLLARAQPAAQEEHRCPYPGCSRALPTKRSLADHTRKVHGKSLTSLTSG